MNTTKVANLRKDRQLTQADLAERAYVTVRTIQRMEAGEDVNDATLNAVSNALGVTVNDLFETIDDTNQEEHIIKMSQQQVLQMNQRESESNVYKLLTVALSFLVLASFGIYILSANVDTSQRLLYFTLWITLLLICIAFDYYLLNVLLARKLDIKYPLSIGTAYKK